MMMMIHSKYYTKRCFGIRKLSMISRLPLDLIFNNRETFDRNLAARRIPQPIAFEDLDNLRIQLKQITLDIEQIRKERNVLSKEAGKNIEKREEVKVRVKEIKEQLCAMESKASSLEAELENLVIQLPNSFHPDVPIMDNDDEGVVVATSSKNPFPVFHGFEPKTHVDLAEFLDIVDFKSPVKTTGTKFVTLKNDGAHLELALAQWALQYVSARGFSPRLTPDIAKSSIISGCGFLPRGESSQIFSVKSESGDHKNSDLCLVGTSEITLAGSMAGERILAQDLPHRMAGFGHCFRVEAGASGKAGKGLYRLHQFSKVEMFSFAHPEQSEAEHETLRKIQEDICDELGLHWRTLNMAAHELGAAAYRKYDIQVYMPSRGDFGEVASVSNCTDYQSRRLDVRFMESHTSQKSFVHTLNGTALAIPRVFLSILETHQRSDGSVAIPRVLQPFMPNQKTCIEPKSV